MPVEIAGNAIESRPCSAARRSDWRNFYVVDPDAGDAPVEQEPYFVAGADGLVTAFYTDARGRAWDQAFPAGNHLVGPKTASEQY